LPEWSYSAKLDDENVVKASLREVDLSMKKTRELLRSLKGMRLPHAREFLEGVIALRRAVPYKRFKKKVPHRRGMAAGRYPVKSAKMILKLLDSLEANAEVKGLNPDNVKIIHAAVHKARKVRKYIPRAFGRSSPYIKELVHVELIGREVE